ncbi:MAG: hypothetical protein NT121_09950 [Chloroflexi bacterium]|nr:hypothetical protein [Chloroflexota bacterium]
MKKLSLIFALLLIPALACSTSSIAESLVSSGDVLYQDIFSNPQSGWGEITVPAGKAGYENGAYHIVVEQPNVNLWSHPGMDFSTTRMEVSLMAAAGPLENRMGLICRLQDDKNYYFFTISADGYYGIGKMKAGQVSLLTGDQMQPSESILTGNQINHLRADCIGNLLILYVNNALVTSAKDDDFTSGDAGILVGTFDQPGADVYFDNFMVIKP